MCDGRAFKCCIFITFISFNRVRLTSPPLSEMYKIEFEQYLPKEEVKEKEEEDEEEKGDDASEAVIASH